MGKMLTRESVDRKKRGEPDPGEEAARVISEIAEDTERQKVKAQGGRTDEEISCQTPLKLMLGGEIKIVPLLPYRKNKEWRDAFRNVQKKQLAYSASKKGMTDDEIKENAGLDDYDASEDMLLNDKVKLVVLYLNLSGVCEEDSILDVANDLELLVAYGKIEAVATPLSETRIPKRS